MKSISFLSTFSRLSGIVILALISACGGGGGSGSTGAGGGGGTTSGTLIGGSIQGKTLNFTGNVSTLAGIATTETFKTPESITNDGTNFYITDPEAYVVRKVDMMTGTVTVFAGTPFLPTTFYFPTCITNVAGYLYVCDIDRIRKISLATAEVTTLVGPISGAQAPFFSGITSDGTNLYATDRAHGRIYKIVISSRVISVFAGGGTGISKDGIGIAARFDILLSSITNDGAYLYVVDDFGKAIRKIEIATASVTTLTTGFTSYLLGNLATDGANLYITSSNFHLIQKMDTTTGALTVLAGTSGLAGHVDGIGTTAQLSYPKVVIKIANDLYFVDTGSAPPVRKLELATNTVVSLLPGAAASKDGIGTQARFSEPRHMTTDGLNLYVAEYRDHTIRMINIATAAVTTLAGLSGNPGTTDDTGSAARFNAPTGITTDGVNLYVTEQQRLRKIVIATGAVSTIPIPISPSMLLAGITTDGTYLYVADYGNYVILKIVITTNQMSVFAGVTGVSGDVDGPGNLARFRRPLALTTDGSFLYVSDVVIGSIRRIDLNSSVVSTIARNSQPLTINYFGVEYGLTTDGTYLYTADSSLHTIRKINLSTGAVSGVAGTFGQSGEINGNASTARFLMPYGITTDGSRLYVSTQLGATIRAIE